MGLIIVSVISLPQIPKCHDYLAYAGKQEDCVKEFEAKYPWYAAGAYWLPNKIGNCGMLYVPADWKRGNAGNSVSGTAPRSIE
jgi:hypothetical protein